ncbi:MAG TPA: type II toxin-antitoxin system RelE/ParE family toxin [Verrucomicrobiae bacterium]|jgi:plasmid stabilization system protein ParE
MKPVAYHRLAASELIKSAQFYEHRNPSLGDIFLDIVEATLLEIQKQPELGQLGKLGTRSWKTRKFPFRIVYLQQSDRLRIVAIAHLSRKPDYWTRRLR